jgi:DNA-binding NtrC family response regulator
MDARNRPGGIVLNPLVFIVDNGKRLSELTIAIARSGIEVLQCSSISDLQKLCQERNRGVVMLDLDDPCVTNRMLGEIARKCPILRIIGVSDRLFHPEFKEAMRSYLYACMSKPVDMEELMYLVKSVFRDLTTT